jgi:hypothetical protein
VNIIASLGRLEYVFDFAVDRADNIDIAASAVTIYVRPFGKTLGSGVAHVEVIRVCDLIDALAIRAARSMLGTWRFRLAAIGSRFS